MDRVAMAHRSAVLDVVVLQAQEDLGGAWRSLLSDPVERAAAGMREVLPAVAEQYGALAGDAAAIWYEDVRPPGATKFAPRAFVPKSLEKATGLTTWAVTPLFSGDEASAWERLAGTIQKLVTDHDRETVERNADRDPAAIRWVRQASADACAYCAFMATNSRVYISLEDWDTRWDDPSAYHDNCRCVPVAEYEGVGLPDQPNLHEWGSVFEDAHAAIARDFRAAWDSRPRQRTVHGGWEYERRNNFFRRRPDLTLTTKNILARARRLEPGLFRDGVPGKVA